MRSYEEFLDKLLDDLVKALAEGENREWHHLPPGDPRYQIYLRLSTWAVEVSERNDRYANSRKAVAKRIRAAGRTTEKEDAMGRHNLELYASDRGKARDQSSLGPDTAGHPGDDLDQDADPDERDGEH